MIELNLMAKSVAQERILNYLQENVSEVLAEKINNGVTIVKDGKTLLSKKTLDGFMIFASNEARKLAEKGARSACVEDDTVYGWAIHYFEENSIEGTLYNADGTEYKPKTPIKNTAVQKPAAQPATKPKPQLSIFDMINASAESAEISDQTDDNELNGDADDEVDEETENADYTPEELQEMDDEQEPTNEPTSCNRQIKQFYQCYLNIQDVYADSIIAYRIDDFFEIFGENAKLIADELNLTLTGRDVGLESRVPMIGIPFHMIDEYVPKITRNGHKIAVVEPQGEITVFDTVEQPKPEADNAYSPAPSEDDILMREREIAKAFDKNALIILSDLLGDIFSLE